MSFKLSALAWNVEVDKSADRLVLLALASKADDNGRNCFPSVESICGLTVLNRKTVFAVISRLADRGLITVRKRVSTNSNEYLLHVDRWTENGSAENGTTQKGDNPKTVQRSSQKRDDGSTENGTTVVPKTGHYSINTQSDTQSITQSESLPAQAPWETDLLTNDGKKVEKPKATRAKPKTSCPFSPDDPIPPEYLEYAQAKHPSINAQTEFTKFVNFHISKDNKFSNWLAAWRTWTTKAEEFAKSRPQSPNQTFPFGKPTDPQYGIGVCERPKVLPREYTPEESRRAREEAMKIWNS